MTDLKKISKEQLRRRLDELSASPVLNDETRYLLHELDVHQVELELQNRELREAQEALEVSRDHYADLYLHAPLGYVTLDEGGRVHDINFVAAGLLGCDRGKAQGRLLYPWLRSEDWPRFVHHLRQARDGARAVLELTLRRGDGEPREVCLQSLGMRQPDDGRWLCRSALLDIGARKAAEIALRRGEELTRSVMDSLGSAIVVLDEQGLILQVNQVWRTFSAENGGSDALGTGLGINYLSVCQHSAQDDPQAAQIWEGLCNILEGRLPELYQEYPCHGPDNRRWFAMRARPLSGAVRGLVVTHTDITPRIFAEEALRETQERYALAMRGANDGIWDWNLYTGELYLSPRWQSMLGYAEGELAHGLETWERLIHPVDRDRVLTKLQDLRAGRCETFEEELRLFHRDGHCCHILSRAFLVRGPQGEPIRLVGTHVDITERKHAEEQLRLAARVFERTAEGVMVTDPQQCILTVNDAFTQVTGYTRDEALGKTPALLKSNRNSPEFYQEMWESLQSKGWWQGEIWNRRKNGDVYLEWLSINSVKDPQGQVLNYVGIFSDITLIKESQRRMEFLATHDALTGLPNRFLLQDRLQLTLARAKRAGLLVAVLFLDLDNFKVINDTLGHHVGDALLKQVAVRLLESVRGGDTVARLGGDEFVVLMEAPWRETVVGVAERIIQSLAAAYLLEDHECFTSASLGISLFPDDGGDPGSLLRQADTALYRAKEQGKNSFRFFTGDMAVQARQRLIIETGLRRAIQQQELFLEYQPQIELATGKPVGAEALVRWRHAGGVVSPAEFIPVAEESGLITEVGEWVIREVCRQLWEWERAGLPSLRVSVNLSARYFRQGDVVARLLTLLAATGISAQHLCLEITEGALMDVERASPMLRRLRGIGFDLSIDDFGTGFSSLAYLKRYPIQELKIDRSFVAGIVRDPDARAIISAITAMSSSLGLRVVAEGVEAAAQHLELQTLGCALGQGYFYARPMPAEALADWLRERPAA